MQPKHQKHKTMNTINEVLDLEKAKCRDFNVKELMTLLQMDKFVWWSWAPRNFLVDNTREPRMFRFLVSGHHHKGYVYIFLNGSDLFDVYLTTTRNTIKHRTDEMGIYFDQLVEWIDDRVERIPQYN